jgi:hypothetical protein
MIAWMMAAALAAPPSSESDRDTHLDLLARTSLPWDIGGRLQGEFPGRLRLGLEVGWVPPAYIDMANAIVEGFGGYDESVSTLISSAVERSVVVGVDVGWRPWPKEGFQFYAGYMGVFAGGGLTGTEALAAVSDAVPSVATSAIDVQLSTTIHLVKTGVSWELVWAERFVMRFDLGGAFTVGSRTTGELETSVGNRVTDAAIDELKVYLDDQIQSWVHSPLIGLSMGVRFF